MTVPAAEAIDVRGKFCKIRCPYCKGIHEHHAGVAKFSPGSHHHRAPGCGLTLTGEQRLTGYQFIIPTKETNR